MTKRSSSPRAARGPEKKFGPYPGGITVDVWLNEVQTDAGQRKIRSISISPRRYRDPDTGDWKDAPSYRPTDIPCLLFGLQRALEYIFTVPITGQPEADGDAPF